MSTFKTLRVSLYSTVEAGAGLVSSTLNACSDYAEHVREANAEGYALDRASRRAIGPHKAAQALATELLEIQEFRAKSPQHDSAYEEALRLLQG